MSLIVPTVVALNHLDLPSTEEDTFIVSQLPKYYTVKISIWQLFRNSVSDIAMLVLFLEHHNKCCSRVIILTYKPATKNAFRANCYG